MIIFLAGLLLIIIGSGLLVSSMKEYQSLMLDENRAIYFLVEELLTNPIGWQVDTSTYSCTKLRHENLGGIIVKSWTQRFGDIEIKIGEYSYSPSGLWHGILSKHAMKIKEIHDTNELTKSLIEKDLQAERLRSERLRRSAN